MLIMSPLMHPYNSDGDYYLYADQEKDNYKWDISNGANKNPIAYLDYYMNQNLSKSHYMQSSFYAELQLHQEPAYQEPVRLHHGSLQLSFLFAEIRLSECVTQQRRRQGYPIHVYV